MTQHGWYEWLKVWMDGWMDVLRILPFSRLAPPCLGHQAPPPPIRIFFTEDHTPSLHLPPLRLHPPLVLLTFSGKGKIWGDYVTPLWRRIHPISQAFLLPFLFFFPPWCIGKMRGWRPESPAASQSQVVFFSHLLLGGIGVPIRNWHPLLWLHTSKKWQPWKPK